MMSRVRGFTLVELIVVIVLLAILSASFIVFFKPAIDAFFAARRRADMTDAADTALRLMAQDIRRAVPNSLRVIQPLYDATNAAACFQMVPTIGGGRYRTDIDTKDVSAVALNDSSTSPYRMSILAARGTTSAKDQFVVINNQNGDDVYGGESLATITTAGSPLTLDKNPTRLGYMGGRFQLVSNSESSVMYTCANNTLTRKQFDKAPAKKTACETDGTLVAGNVSRCELSYGDAGATNGLLTMTLVMRHPVSGESVALSYAVHVDNAP